MARHTAKALTSTIKTGTGRHTAAAQGRQDSRRGAKSSGHTDRALAFTYGKNQGSKGGGTSALTKGFYGTAHGVPYGRRNSTGRPMSR